MQYPGGKLFSICLVLELKDQIGAKQHIIADGTDLPDNSQTGIKLTKVALVYDWRIIDNQTNRLDEPSNIISPLTTKL